MANYEQELANFRQQWNLPNTYDLHQLASSVQALRFADSFLMGASSDNSPAGQFVKWFSRTLSFYFETNTTPNENGKYISSFNAQAFYDSFKALVQAKYDSDAQEKGETPLQVGEVVTNDLKSTIQNVIANCKRAYKKTLPTLWQEKLKKGYMQLETLRNVTSSAYDEMMNINVDKVAMKGKLMSVVAAYEAMTAIRESRKGFFGWFWKFFNGDKNRQEEGYHELLKGQVEMLEKWGYDVHNVAEELTGKTVFGKNVTNEKTNASPEQGKQATVKVEPVVGELEGKVKSMVAEPDFKNDFIAGVIESLPNNDEVTSNMQKALFTGMLESSFIDKIQEFNKKFDAQEVKTDEYILAGAKEVFKKAYTATRALGYKQAVERLVVAQLLTDKIMQKFSPVAFETEKYAQFGNGYVLKNANELLKDMEGIDVENEDMLKDDAREITFNKANKAYDDMTREKLKITDVNQLANDQVAPPVQDSSVIQNTVVNKK